MVPAGTESTTRGPALRRWTQQQPSQREIKGEEELPRVTLHLSFFPDKTKPFIEKWVNLWETVFLFLWEGHTLFVCYSSPEMLNPTAMPPSRRQPTYLFFRYRCHPIFVLLHTHTYIHTYIHRVHATCVKPCVTWNSLIVDASTLKTKPNIKVLVDAGIQNRVQNGTRVTQKIVFQYGGYIFTMVCREGTCLSICTNW